MKNILIAGFAAALSIGFAACNNGAYDANPSTNNSGTSNPLNNGSGNNGGGNSSFNWSGSDPMSAKIDGVFWQAEDATFLESSVGIDGYIISGIKGNSTFAILLNKSIQAGNTYDLVTGQTNYTASYTVSNDDPATIYGANVNGAGGKIKILELDATHIKGLFYFTGKQVPTYGTNTMKIEDGYFNIQKD